VRRLREIIIAIIVAPMCVLSFASSASANAGRTDISGIVNNYLPGATATVQPAPVGSNSSGDVLAIALPSSDIPGGESALQMQFIYHELGWKARVAAALVAQADPNVTSYTLTTAKGDVPADAFNDFHGGFMTGSQTADPSLDSILPSLALQQLQSNLDVLVAAMLSGSVTQAVATLLPTNPSGNQFVVEADVSIDQASSLNGFYGDALVGLQTGLTGGPTSDVVEGVAIVVTASNGSPVFGAWHAARSQSGVMQFADPNDASQSLQVTASFPNLTGGPSTIAASTGSGIPTPSGSSGKSDIAVASPAKHHPADQKRPVAVSSQIHMHAPTGGQGGGFGAWWVAIAAGMVAAIAIFLGSLRRWRVRLGHAI
jgi:hypothetical protein